MSDEVWQLIGGELQALDRLAYMVVPRVFRGRADLIPPDASALRRSWPPDGSDGRGGFVDQEALTAALYERLAAHRLHYDVDPPNGGYGDQQLIRQPWEVFTGGRFTCIDLALVFCGMALEAQLFPLLAVMRLVDQPRHAVVLIAPQTRDTHDAPLESTLDDSHNTAAELGLAELLERGWIAVDITLAAHDALSPTTGTFAQARAAARSALESAEKIRILDIARRHLDRGPFAAKDLAPLVEGASCAVLRELYGPALARAGVVPGEWSLAELRSHLVRHRAGHPSSSPTGDLLEALCAALQARAVFTSVGGDGFGLAPLRHLYAEHVGQTPWDAHSADEMLVLAASAGTVEIRSANRQDLSPLARFLLAVAGHAEEPRNIDLESDRYRMLGSWLTTTLGHQRNDVVEYLHDLRHRTWALMELEVTSSPAAADRPWPRGVVVQLVDLLGKVTTRRFPCRESSERGLKHALRQAADFLPGRGVIVDLVVPRAWLDAGLEHWDVVDVGGTRDPMTRDLQPRMRWSGYQHDRLRERLHDRLRRADWLGAPALLPGEVAGDRALTTQWVTDPSDGPGLSPYLVGCPPPGGGDPLDALLHEGCGFIVWFATQPEETALQAACLPCEETGNARERRSSLPRHLADRLRGNRQTTVIWNDPEGRDSFRMPPPRRRGTLRRGGTQ